MAANSFKKLEQENEQQFRGQDIDRKIERNVKQSTKLFRFIGDVFELYLPRVFGMFMGGAQSSFKSNDSIAEHASDSDNPKYPNNTNRK